MVRDSTIKLDTKYWKRLRQVSRLGNIQPISTRHGAQHSFNPPDEGGDSPGYMVDTYALLVYHPALMVLGNVLIYPYTFYRIILALCGGTGTASMLTYKPTGTTTARMVLIYIDDSDAPAYVGGNEFSASLDWLQYKSIHYIPSIPTTSGCLLLELD